MTEVDLQLLAGWRFDSNGREGRDPLLASKVGDGALNRALAHGEAVSGQQSPHDHSIATCWAAVQLAGPRPRVVGQPPRRGSDLYTRPDRLPQISPHRVTRDADLACDRLATDPATRQLTNRGHDFAFDHRYLRCRRYQNARLELHSTLL